MSFKATINKYRRRVMQSFGNIIISKDADGMKNFNDKVQLKRVLISRPNSRLGNQLLITPLIQELISISPNVKIDVFCRGGLAPILFEGYTNNIGNIIKLPAKPFKELGKYISVWLGLKKDKYDLAISVSDSSFSGRFAVAVSNSKYRLFCNNKELTNIYPTSKHLAKTAIFHLRHYMSSETNNRLKMPIPTMNLQLSDAEMQKGKQAIKEMQLPDAENKKTICIYTYATGAKCYKPNWWLPMYDKLKDKFGAEYNIIEMLPKENVSQINFTSPNFYSLNIREMTAILANTSAVIAADSGIMHLASASGTPTIGLFCTTNPQMYAPYNQGSLVIETDKVSDEESQEAILAGLENILKSTSC